MDKASKLKLIDFKHQSASLMAVAALYDELSAILEDFQSTITSLETSQTALVGQIEVLQKENKSLKGRYSELLYKFSEVIQASK